jgi:integrase
VAVAEPTDTVTLARFIETYCERRSTPVTTNDRSCLAKLAAFTPAGADTSVGQTALATLTEDVVEVFLASLRSTGRAASTHNKYVQAITRAVRWAAKKGYLSRNVLEDSESVRRESEVSAKRHRRLSPDVLRADGTVEREGEERRLLTAANPQLQRLIIAALETGCRRGELLALQWRDVDGERKELTVRAETSKTRRARVLPLSARVLAVLEMARAALETRMEEAAATLSEAERAELVARCYVFGDEAGGKVANTKRAWETAVLKAHGHTPTWTKTSKGLVPASRAALAAIDLDFHDLRHEAGSRLLEAGWPLHHVQLMLGHANVSQTSTYLNATKGGLRESMRRLDDARCNPVAKQEQTVPPPVRNDEQVSTAQVVVN